MSHQQHNERSQCAGVEASVEGWQVEPLRGEIVLRRPGGEPAVVPLPSDVSLWEADRPGEIATCGARGLLEVRVSIVYFQFQDGSLQHRVMLEVLTEGEVLVGQEIGIQELFDLVPGALHREALAIVSEYIAHLVVRLGELRYEPEQMEAVTELLARAARELDEAVQWKAYSPPAATVDELLAKR